MKWYKSTLFFKPKVLLVIAWGLRSLLCITFFFGVLYWVTGEVDTSNKGIVKFFDCLYFSLVTFATIGYGDIAPLGPLSKILVVIEASVGIVFTPVFGGLLFFEIMKRSHNIIFSRNAFLREIDGNIFFSIRIGNMGVATTDNVATIEFCKIVGTTKRTIKRHSQNTPVVETAWQIEFGLGAKKNEALVNALKRTIEDSNNSFIRLSFSGVDFNTGQTVDKFQDYRVSDLATGGRFVGVVTYDGIKASLPNWDNFDKTESLDEEQNQRIISMFPALIDLIKSQD